jgi:D-3-phosphoglycerate dehydrogenase / 2-oxoglutarate reductase
MRPRILLTHTPEMRTNYYGDRAVAGLRAVGEVILHEAAAPLDAAALVARAIGCRIIVADRATAVPEMVFAQLPALAAVVRVAVDIRNIDVAAASRTGVLVTQASRSWVPAVAELAIGLLIDAARGVSAANIAYKAGKAPAVRMGRQLFGATIGIIGFGPLGRRVAELAGAFDMRILMHDPYVAASGPGITAVDLDTLMSEADFVMPLAVATAETENLIDARRLSLMKPTALLINVSRGNLIDEGAIAEALDRRRIAGAALDVGRAPDQMPSPVLAQRSDVVATPHIGGLTREAIETMAMETVSQVEQIARGVAPIGAVNAADWRRADRS